MKKIAGYLSIAALTLIFSCNNSDKQTSVVKDPSDTTKKTAKTKTKATADVRKPATINLMDTISAKKIVVYMKDSAATFERISFKLGQIFGSKLTTVFKTNKLKATGAPMAWYKSQKAPYFFEAGIPVNKKPANLPKDVFVREMGLDSVVVAHFYGPYDLMQQGYDAANDRIKYTNRKLKAPAYEMYISDSIDKKGKPVDPYKVQTDIIFPVY